MTVQTKPTVVNTKKVKGRREVRYESLDDLLEEARQFADAEQVEQLGNWSPGQIYEHLAETMNGSIDGIDFQLPKPAQWLMTLLFKRKFLYDRIPAGFPASKSMIPDPTSNAAGLELLQQAISRQKATPSRAPHPAFGDIGREPWIAFHLRHAEMHMSFLKLA